VADEYRHRLIVALDVGGYDEAAKLVEMLAPRVGFFKVGSVLFTREGPRICRLVKDAGAGLFLDMKFHDIPNTVHGAVRSACDLDADMLTVHLTGGEAMLEAARKAKEESGKKNLKIVGVTVLTHLTFEDFHSLFLSDRSKNETVLALAKLAGQAGLDGVVASALEAPLIRRHMGPEFAVVTPGIRLPGAEKDDQVRVATPKKAIQAGASHIVVGRPITADPDPLKACEKILEDMAS
jgi:orotidine-5'-phosphate decarboxylase